MEFVQQNAMWILIAVASGAMLIWPMISGADANALSPADATLKINREDAIVLDVRESSEWSAGHIPNARHITLGQLEKRLSEIEKFKAKPIIVCCATGNRSTSACKTLKQAGFEQVFNLGGGIASWQDANLPMTKKN
jgi:rhodanese-related sulfurtransferase